MKPEATFKQNYSPPPVKKIISDGLHWKYESRGKNSLIKLNRVPKEEDSGKEVSNLLT